MLFHITYKVTTKDRDEVQDRFRKTGAQPPEGVRLQGRWHSVNGNKGFILAESSDLPAIGKWVQEWSDMLNFDVTPVLSDEQILHVIEEQSLANVKGH
ncbi:MAG TPA: DUF3303 family protein [Balneolales bacterium]|nr:DUF3303 family protein [Balneolales bacterium]